MAFATPVRSILKTSRTDSVKKVQFKPISTNGLHSTFQLEHLPIKSQNSTRIFKEKPEVITVSSPSYESSESELASSSSLLLNDVEKIYAGFEGDEYEVEAIVCHKKYKGDYLYLLKWKGYSAAENTWEPASNLYCTDLLDEYRKKFNLSGSQKKKSSTSSTPKEEIVVAAECKLSDVKRKQKLCQEHAKSSDGLNGMSDFSEESSISEPNRKQLSNAQDTQTSSSTLNSFHKIGNKPRRNKLELIVHIDLSSLGRHDVQYRKTGSMQEMANRTDAIVKRSLSHSLWCVSHDHTYFTPHSDTKNYSANAASTCPHHELMQRTQSAISSFDSSLHTMKNMNGQSDDSDLSIISITSGSSDSCDLKLYLSPSSSTLSGSDHEICDVDDESDHEKLFQPDSSMCRHSHKQEVQPVDASSRWKGPMPLPRSFSKRHSCQSRLKTKAAKLDQKCKKCAVGRTRTMSDHRKESLRTVSSPVRVNGNCHVVPQPFKAPLPVIEINHMVSYKFTNDYAYKELLMNWQYELNKQRDGTDNIILVENEMDIVPPPASFHYISSNIYRKGVPDPASSEMTNSLCGCECYYLGRKCGPKSTYCCAHMAGSKFAYSPAGKVRVPPGTPIYECNIKCSCRVDCPNRIVQLGRQFPLCIFRTRGRGWGVKATQPIKSNTFVSEYVGEVITNDEAEKRGEKCDAQGITYLFDLDFEDDNSAYTVDAANYGNISHFFNHSCDPNLIVYSVWIDTLDKRLPRLAFFTTRNISIGEELTFDYQMSRNRDYSNGSGSRMRCLCGSKNCLGYID